MVLLYGCDGRITTIFGGFRPGQRLLDEPNSPKYRSISRRDDAGRTAITPHVPALHCIRILGKRYELDR